MPIQQKWKTLRSASAILGAFTVLWLVSYCAALESVRSANAAGNDHRATRPGVERPVRMNGSQDPIRDQLERLSEAEIKRFYARCSLEGIDRRLDGGEAMACSVGYDILLKKHFGGDFDQLLRWSRAEQAAIAR